MSSGLAIFTLAHVVISLIAIGSGFVVLFGLLSDKEFQGWTPTFLTTTVATSVTGFFFPVHHFMPSHAVGIVSLLLLSLAIYARYRRAPEGAWSVVYSVTAMVSLYLNVFVLVAQLFLKVPLLKSLAEAGAGLPVAITQLAVSVIFIVMTAIAATRFHGQQPQTHRFTVPTI